MAGTFKFIGKIELNKLDSKNPPYRIGKTGGGSPYASFNMSVAASKSNRGYVEVFGMERDTISTYDFDGNEITIKWEDREDPEVIKKVAYYKRFIIEMDGERHEFVSDYDFVKFLIANNEIIKGKTFIVKGQIKPNVYKGKVSLRYNFNSMIEVTDEATVPSLVISNVYYYGAEDIDTADWSKEKVININGYTDQNFGKEEGHKYVATPFVIDCSKANLDNPDVVKQLTFKLKQLGLELNDSIKVKVKKDAIVSMQADCNYVNGNKEIPFDESQLTDNQRAAIEFGINTLDDFRPKGSIFGDKITLLKYKGSDLRSPYEDGYKVEDITVKDFTDAIWKDETAKEETTSDLDKKIEEAEEDVDLLFS